MQSPLSVGSCRLIRSEFIASIIRFECTPSAKQQSWPNCWSQADQRLLPPAADIGCAAQTLTFDPIRKRSIDKIVHRKPKTKASGICVENYESHQRILSDDYFMISIQAIQRRFCRIVLLVSDRHRVCHARPCAVTVRMSFVRPRQCTLWPSAHARRLAPPREPACPQDPFLCWWKRCSRRPAPAPPEGRLPGEGRDLPKPPSLSNRSWLSEQKTVLDPIARWTDPSEVGVVIGHYRPPG